MIATSRKGLSWNRKSTITRIIIMKARWDLFYWLYKEKRELPMKNRPCAIPCRSRQKVESRKSCPLNMFERSNVEKIVHWICSNTWVSKNIECHFRIKYAKTQKPVFFRTCSNDRVSKKNTIEYSQMLECWKKFPPNMLKRSSVENGFYWICLNAQMAKKFSIKNSQTFESRKIFFEYSQTIECRKSFPLNMFKRSNFENVFLRIFSNARVSKKYLIQHAQTLECWKLFSIEYAQTQVSKKFATYYSNTWVLKKVEVIYLL